MTVLILLFYDLICWPFSFLNIIWPTLEIRSNIKKKKEQVIYKRNKKEKEIQSFLITFFMSVSKRLIGTLVRAHLLMANQSLTLKEREALKARPIP